MENKPRREFLKKSLLGVSCAALAPTAIGATLPSASAPSMAAPLPTRQLGKTGIDTPLISMGAGNATNTAFVQAAYRSGVKLFFSATYYGEGNNERLVGEALKDFPRDSFIVGTAVPPDGFDHKEGTFAKDTSTAAYLKKAEESLKRFGLDYIDIVLLPYVGKRESVFFEPLLNAMQQLKQQGKARFVGIATHSFCDEALRAAADTGVYDIAMPAYNFKNENKEAMDDAVAYAAKAGMGIIAMKSTAGVFRDKSRTTPLNSDAALKWVLQNQNISSIVSGMSSIEQLQKNLAMINHLKMTPEELQELACTETPGEPGLYCRQCHSCVAQCRQNLDIPTLMRSYMYAYGYQNTAQAKHTLELAGIGENVCHSCDSCTVQCISGFDVRNRVADIARLKDVPYEFLVG